VRTGFSISELIISPSEIIFSGISKPDILVILSADGLTQAAHWLAIMVASDLVFIDDQLPVIETLAQVRKLALWKVGRKSLRSLAALAAVLGQNEFIPIEAFKETINLQIEQPGSSLKALEQGLQSVFSAVDL
jgi:hypothetical protein